MGKIRDLLDKACMWHEEIGILDTLFALYDCDDSHHFWSVEGVTGRLLRRVDQEAEEDCFGRV